MSKIVKEIRQLRSDLHSSIDLGEYKFAEVIRLFSILSKMELTKKQYNKIKYWLDAAWEDEKYLHDWLRFADHIEMAVIELGHCCFKNFWDDYPKKGEYL